MCEERDAMRQVRAAARCLSGACQYQEGRGFAVLYEAVLEEPIPEHWLDMIAELDRRGAKPLH